MNEVQIQKKIINKLLDLYENSKTFLAENRVTQTFSQKVSALFPKYADDAEYEVFCEVNRALGELETLGLLRLTKERGGVVSKVILNVDHLGECYAFVGREPKRERQDWLAEVWKDAVGCPVLERYCDAQRARIAKNKSVEYDRDDKAEYRDMLAMVRALAENGDEVFLRDFSIRLFGDSKRAEKLAASASALMYEYGDYQEKESVLEECGVVKTPTYVCVKGNGSMLLGGQRIDLSQLEGDIALSTKSLAELERVEVFGGRVVTIENLTSFHDYANADDFALYLGGFHNRTKRDFLKFLYAQNPEVAYRHFGDIDAGGFYILEHLKVKTGMPFQSLMMGADVLRKYAKVTKPLTANDRKRLASLLKKWEEAGSVADEGDVETVRYMLENGCKLEQEAVKI